MTDILTSAITLADADGTSPDVAPEKIWASCQIQHVGNRNNYHNGWDEKPETLLHEEWAQEPTEYIRLDLHTEALAAERARADAAYALGVAAALAEIDKVEQSRVALYLGNADPGRAAIKSISNAIRALAAQPPAALAVPEVRAAVSVAIDAALAEMDCGCAQDRSDCLRTSGNVLLCYRDGLSDRDQVIAAALAALEATQ